MKNEVLEKIADQKTKDEKARYKADKKKYDDVFRIKDESIFLTKEVLLEVRMNYWKKCNYYKKIK